MRPDDQGALGEHHFVGLCIKAGIDCNKAAWDKMGWDFRVELRSDVLRPTRSLDRDLKPSTFLVQVKTIAAAGKKSVRLTLPAADKLAKDPQNSLVVVFLVDQDMIVGMNIIPIIDTALGEILRALRKCDVEAPREYRQRNVSLSLTGSGIDVAPTPNALRIALEGFAKEDAFAHAVRKQEQIRSLGYGARPIVGTFKTIRDADMVPFFLGEKAVEVHDLTTHEHRFGIARKLLTTVAAATMQLDSAWIINVVTFGSKLARGQVSLDGKIFVMPYHELGSPRLRVVTDDMQLNVTNDSASFSPMHRESSARLSLKSRIRTCQAYEYISMGRTTLLFRLENERKVEVTSEDKEQTQLLHAYRAHHALLKKFLDVVCEAGLEDYEISDDVIEEAANKVANLHKRLSSSFTVWLSNIDPVVASGIPGLPRLSEEIDAYVTDYISLGEHLIGYYFVGRARLIDRGAHYDIEIRDCVIRNLAVLGSSAEAYDAYGSDIGRNYVGAVGIIMNKQTDG